MSDLPDSPLTAKGTDEIAFKRSVRPRKSRPSNLFARLWGPPASARTAIIGLAVLIPILGAVPVILFAPSALVSDYFKFVGPLVTTGLGYLFGRAQRG